MKHTNRRRSLDQVKQLLHETKNHEITHPEAVEILEKYRARKGKSFGLGDAFKHKMQDKIKEMYRPQLVNPNTISVKDTRAAEQIKKIDNLVTQFDSTVFEIENPKNDYAQVEN